VVLLDVPTENPGNLLHDHSSSFVEHCLPPIV
jgi:hypothetical protein